MACELAFAGVGFIGQAGWSAEDVGESFSHITLNEVAVVTRLKLADVEQDENVGAGKGRIPAGFAADLRTEAHVSLEQRRHTGFATQGQGGFGQAAFGRDAQIIGAHEVAAQLVHDAVCCQATVLHGNAGAAKQMADAVLLHERGQPLPEHANGRAIAVLGMHAGAPDFHDFTGQAGEHVQFKFVGRIESACHFCLGASQQAGAGHQLVVLLVDDQKVLAIGIVVIEFAAMFVHLSLRAHLDDKNLVAQALAALNFGGCLRELDAVAAIVGLEGRKHGVLGWNISLSTLDLHRCSLMKIW